MKKILLIACLALTGTLAQAQTDDSDELELISPNQPTAKSGKSIECQFGSRDFKVTDNKISITLDARGDGKSLDLGAYKAELESGTEGPPSIGPTEASLTINEKSGKEVLRLLWQLPTRLENITTHGFTGLVYLNQTTAKPDSRELQLWCSVTIRKP